MPSLARPLVPRTLNYRDLKMTPRPRVNTLSFLELARSNRINSINNLRLHNLT